jgi:hypothetical protein
MVDDWSAVRQLLMMSWFCQFSNWMSSSQFKCRRDVIYDMKLRIRGQSVMGRRCGVVRSACRPHWRHSQRDEIATDCRIDLMSDLWPLLVAEPLDGERW